jgi:hypothetical protein
MDQLRMNRQRIAAAYHLAKPQGYTSAPLDGEWNGTEQPIELLTRGQE